MCRDNTFPKDSSCHWDDCRQQTFSLIVIHRNGLKLNDCTIIKLQIRILHTCLVQKILIKLSSLKFKITTELRHFEFEIQLCLEMYVSKCMCDKTNLLERYHSKRNNITLYNIRHQSKLHKKVIRHVCHQIKNSGQFVQIADFSISVRVKNKKPFMDALAFGVT